MSTTFLILMTFLFCKYGLKIKNYSLAYEPETVVYAKVDENCALYKTIADQSSLSEIIFYVPSTYFVTILSQTSTEILRVRYENFTGYVYSKNVSVVSFTPSKPILTDITFDISENAGTQIWSKPSDATGRILTTISAGSLGIEYVASTLGDIPSGGKSNLWYFARFTPTTNTTTVYEGYVYSEATTNLTHIPTNLEQDIEEISIDKTDQLTLATPVQIVLLSIISLPFLILISLVIVKIIKGMAAKRRDKIENTAIQNQTQSVPIQSNHFIRKKKQDEFDDESVEVVFPEYDYVDDDDLL